MTIVKTRVTTPVFQLCISLYLERTWIQTVFRCIQKPGRCICHLGLELELGFGMQNPPSTRVTVHVWSNPILPCFDYHVEVWEATALKTDSENQAPCTALRSERAKPSEDGLPLRGCTPLRGCKQGCSRLRKMRRRSALKR